VFAVIQIFYLPNPLIPSTSLFLTHFHTCKVRVYISDNKNKILIDTPISKTMLLLTRFQVHVKYKDLTPMLILIVLYYKLYYYDKMKNSSYIYIYMSKLLLTFCFPVISFYIFHCLKKSSKNLKVFSVDLKSQGVFLGLPE